MEGASGSERASGHELLLHDRLTRTHVYCSWRSRGGGHIPPFALPSDVITTCALKLHCVRHAKLTYRLLRYTIHEIILVIVTISWIISAYQCCVNCLLSPDFIFTCQGRERQTLGRKGCLQGFVHFFDPALSCKLTLILPGNFSAFDSDRKCFREETGYTQSDT